ncbi:NADH:flavin oxidoreductase [Novosphingobium sp. TH158]|uniref:NADH:flavin oxidoreductase n=1 Tax=Novosphingobium sp. TH158 TaxID=2067455 RepID=UPI000C79AE0C|nr:NADH:flavin oxidoreductase [Novosphingobium sp. TH158]PLK26724.1 12-oxophytodienoate reductase [Novosphingobium sp. TH158]
MALSTDSLFKPLQIGSMKLDNRIVMAPMTRGFAIDGEVSDAHVQYYRRRAQGGVGLLVTEGVVVDRPASRNEPNVPKFYGPALQGWKPVVEAVHATGGAIAPQVWHTGAVRSSTMDWEPDSPVESPSGLYAPGEGRGKAMSEEDIADTVAAFAKAARDAKDLGFDCVEVHGAHGYLVDQFFWGGTNLRTDRYGGPGLVQRSRFAAEIVAAIRGAVGADFPLILRVSQWKQQDYSVRLTHTPKEMEAWLLPLVEAGVDVLHCSQRRFWTPEFPEIDGDDGLNFAGWAKKLTGARTISVGSVGLDGDFLAVFKGQFSQTAGIDDLLERMDREEFDMIAVGRALITDPDWAVKVRDGRLGELVPFSSEALAEFV